MKNFQYAEPRTETEAVELLGGDRSSVVLAGGTDLVPLLKSMVVCPDRVVNIMEIPALREIDRQTDGTTVLGATVTLDECLASPHMAEYRGVTDAILGMGSIQLQSQGTLGGDLCQRPQCWYFRSGENSLTDGQRVLVGDHRYHAILGNEGAAKFVNSSRLAPVLIAIQARVRVRGPEPSEAELVPLSDFYRTPRTHDMRENCLEAGQLLTHIVLPPVSGWYTATYDVRQSEGADFPLASAAAALQIRGGVVRQARVVLGQVAPVPWIARNAADSLVGLSINETTAERAGQEAVRLATPLPDNEYKVQLAKVAVKRAVLRAAGLETGGF